MSAGPSSHSLDFEQVVVDDVSRFYGRRRALSHVTFECAAGQLLGLLGPNGAGKSTLLSVLATLTEPSEGEVHYGSLRAADAGSGLRRHIGFLSHDLQLYPELSARENLVFFGGLYGVSSPHHKADEALATAGLTDRADDVVEGFSRGMRQRLALERTLLHDPRLLLLDEPFTGLDEASCAALIRRLRDLRELKRIVVLATHDLDTVDGLLDRAMLLRAGRLHWLDDEGTLRDRYRAALAEGRS
ncbi:MAG: ABC transporter ATP-binding protein [Acidobacteriota bacterium]|nr:ABC transporter ATP-binding protein [Acidobacteriota bacterium]